MPTLTKFQDFSEQLARGVHDWDAHTFKWALTNVAPVATNTILANITQIAANYGYTTGGNAFTVSISETSGTTTVSGTNTLFTCAGSSMATFRYAVLYNDSATSPADALIAWVDYGSAVTLAVGETLTIKFNNASPGTILTIA